MTESLFYIQRIRAQYDTGIFSKSDKRIADYLLEHPGAVDAETASSIAEKVGTSPATVVRFCRKLGFKGLTDMKNCPAYRNYIESSTTDMDLKKGDNAETVTNKVLQYMKMVLDQLKLSLEPELLQKAADKLADANHVVILAEGGSGTIARAAYDIFLKLAIPCRIVDDIMFQIMEISMMDENDVLFLILNSGRTYNVLQNASYAKQRGIYTIGVVGTKGTPLSKYLDIELPTCIFSSSYLSDISAARLCELVTVSILHSIMALTRDSEQMKRGERIANSIELKRIPGNQKF